MAHELGQGMVANRRFGIPELGRKRTGAEVAGRAHFENNAALGQQVHQRRVAEGGDAVPDTLHTEQFDRLSDFFRATDLAGMHQATKTGFGGTGVDTTELLGFDLQLVAADTEGDDPRRVAKPGPIDDLRGAVGAKLADSVKNPVQAKAFRFKRLSGGEYGFEVCLGILVAKKHHTDGERDLGVGHILRDQLLGKIGGDEGEIGGLSQKRSDPFESVNELVEVGVGIALLNVGFGERYTMPFGKRSSYRRADGAFQMNVEFGLGELRDPGGKFARGHLSSLAAGPDAASAHYRDS